MRGTASCQLSKMEGDSKWDEDVAAEVGVAGRIWSAYGSAWCQWVGRLADDLEDGLEAFAAGLAEHFEEGHFAIGDGAAEVANAVDCAVAVGGESRADGIGADVHLVVCVQQVEGSLVDADVCLDADQDDLGSAQGFQGLWEPLRSEAAEGQFLKSRCVSSGLGDFRDGGAQAGRILLCDQDGDVQGGGAAGHDAGMVEEAFWFEHGWQELLLDVDNQQGGVFSRQACHVVSLVAMRYCLVSRFQP